MSLTMTRKLRALSRRKGTFRISQPSGVETRGPGTTGDVSETHPDLPPEFRVLYTHCASETMTSVERMYGLYEAVRHVTHERIEGDIVECGVWRGGSSMLAASTLMALGERRDIWLYDTFEGMPPPSPRDVDHSGLRAADVWEEVRRDPSSNVLALATRGVAEANLASTGYPQQRLHFVVGRVEDTIPERAPERIALLRLDTDWFDSTYHELVHLYPRLVVGGVLIIDDYGHWRGAREAVDRYFAERGGGPLLARLDYTGRMAVKPGPPPAL
jgi:O-methyltransferase